MLPAEKPPRCWNYRKLRKPLHLGVSVQGVPQGPDLLFGMQRVAVYDAPLVVRYEEGGGLLGHYLLSDGVLVGVQAQKGNVGAAPVGGR